MAESPAIAWLALSPSHSPHSSFTKLPPQSPAQSNAAEPPHSPAQSSTSQPGTEASAGASAAS